MTTETETSSVINVELASQVERLHYLRKHIDDLKAEEDDIKAVLTATKATEIEGINVKAAISYIAETQAIDNAALVKFLAPKDSVKAKFMKKKAAYAVVRILPM